MSLASAIARRPENVLATVGPVVTLVIFVTWLLMVFRAMPVPIADFGMFVTVAERLKAGDTLYVDVFENKDPLAHYALALARFPSPFGAWALHLGYLALASAAAYALARRLGEPVRLAALVGFGCVPFVLTGVAFGAGTSHMVGIALCLWLAALRWERHAVLIGVLLGLLPFFKVVMVPVALAIVGYDLIRLHPGRASIIRVGTGAGLSLAISTATLAFRGELVPYLEALRWNSVYASALGPSSGMEALRFHLSSVITPANAIVLVVGATLAAIALVLRPRGASGVDEQGRLLWLTLLTFACGLLVVAASGLWPHHALVFMVPAVLAFCAFASTLTQRAAEAGRSTVGVLLVSAIALSGWPGPAAYFTPIEYARANVNVYLSTPPEAKLILESGPPTTYARVGGGDDGAHAYGLADWTLACPFFTQFTWESTEVLDVTLQCLPSANVILVASDVTADTGRAPWDAYVTAVYQLLQAEYECRAVEGRQICRRPGT